ncbi:methionine ABC transporter ATP-binding protein [Dermacoccus barathri]|uniref:methionine ABC transporter ATP-binding protein n=1 Tax=Dermacoccus barathri TaxID=322601 RepID=UPI00187AE94A|nr:methionine ABC transporter ATP-binding protein [Dermacoccus barathri]MBE7370732.1 methionine ABC transporter ATP-binding protein [Dermacoccus barathri]
MTPTPPNDTTPAVRLRGVSKTFVRGSKEVSALQDVDLDVATGRVLAVIGFSGAGKSTLVRLINALETPTTGTVEVDGIDLTSLNAKKIRALRARIGMVFQQFNLIRSRTVYANVAYPLEVAGWDKAKIEARITELLHFVGLTEKAWAYPDELSGGQKQRVGIARALATNPEILLADESTSALDPDTTKDVLALLRRVNDELGVTIVVITHEMDVVRELADDVVVLEHGRLVESGPTEQVLGSPASPATRRLVDATLRNVPDAREIDLLRRRVSGRLVTATVHDSAGFGRVLASTGARNVEPEIVHGGLTPLKEANLTTLTLALRGDDDTVTQMLTDLAQVATVHELEEATA